MKTYVALDRDNRSLVTVIAHDEQEAADKIREQLDRPGRRAYLAQWLASGAVVACLRRQAEKPATRKSESPGGSQ